MVVYPPIVINKGKKNTLRAPGIGQNIYNADC